MKELGIMLGVLLLSLISVLAGSLIFWGFGNLVIYVFKLDYNWTFLMGVICEFIYLILK